MSVPDLAPDDDDVLSTHEANVLQISQADNKLFVLWVLVLAGVNKAVPWPLLLSPFSFLTK